MALSGESPGQRCVSGRPTWWPGGLRGGFRMSRGGKVDMTHLQTGTGGRWAMTPRFQVGGRGGKWSEGGGRSGEVHGAVCRGGTLRNWVWRSASPLALHWVFPAVAELPVKGKGRAEEGGARARPAKPRASGPESPPRPVLPAGRYSVWATGSPLSKGPPPRSTRQSSAVCQCCRLRRAWPGLHPARAGAGQGRD